MQFDKFTIKSQEALSGARSIASENGHQSIEDVHIMSAMLKQKDGIIIPVLQKLETDPDDFRAKVESLIKNIPKVSGGAAQLYISNELNNILDDSFKEAQQLKDEFGASICFWGGGCNTQHVLSTGTPEAVAGNVRSLVRTFKKNSGFVFNQVHNIMGDVPPENIVAMLDTAYEESFYDTARTGEDA